MPLYHGENFTLAELCELWGKCNKKVKKMVKHAEELGMSLEKYYALYVEKQKDTDSLSGKIWVNKKGICRKCKKSFTKTGKWHTSCPVCSKDQKYNSNISEFFDRHGVLDKRD